MNFREVLLPGMRPEEFAIINGDWRYISYGDGWIEIAPAQGNPDRQFWCLEIQSSSE